MKFEFKENQRTVPRCLTLRNERSYWNKLEKLVRKQQEKFLFWYDAFRCSSVATWPCVEGLAGKHFVRFVGFLLFLDGLEGGLMELE